MFFYIKKTDKDQNTNHDRINPDKLHAYVKRRTS